MTDARSPPDWRNYIANHAHSRDITGPGVVGFDARFIDALDPNREALNLPGRFGLHRFDFVVHRVDGTACRLHPGEKQDGKLVHGRVQNWRFHARAPTPGQAPTPSLTGPIDRVYGHVDIFSAERAHRRIMDLFHEHPGTPAELAVDLLDGDFPWNLFLLGRPWEQILLNEEVTLMHLVCNERQEPVIDVFTRADPFNRRRITFNGGRARLSA